MKYLSVLTSWSTLREISFLSSAENIHDSMAIGIIIIRVVFFDHAKPHEVLYHYNIKTLDDDLLSLYNCISCY